MRLILDAGQATDLKVTESDFAIVLSTPVATAGIVNLTIHNDGPAAHKLVMFRTDLPADKLPLDAEDNMDEENPALVNVFDTGNADLEAGETRTATVDLAPGNYVLVCSLPGHYAMGMYAPLVVVVGARGRNRRPPSRS